MVQYDPNDYPITRLFLERGWSLQRIADGILASRTVSRTSSKGVVVEIAMTEHLGTFRAIGKTKAFYYSEQRIETEGFDFTDPENLALMAELVPLLQERLTMKERTPIGWIDV